MLVPGIAFDLRGHRLGRGRGFYDRLLAEDQRCEMRQCALTNRLLEKLPTEPHDVEVDFILTPARCVKSQNGQLALTTGAAACQIGMPSSQPCGEFHGRTEAFSGSSVEQPLTAGKEHGKRTPAENHLAARISFQEAGCAGLTSSPSITSPSFQPGTMLAMLRSFSMLRTMTLATSLPSRLTSSSPSSCNALFLADVQHDKIPFWIHHKNFALEGGGQA